MTKKNVNAQKFIVTMVKEGVRPISSPKGAQPGMLYLVGENGRKIVMQQWLTGHIHGNEIESVRGNIWLEQIQKGSYERGKVIEIDLDSIKWHVPTNSKQSVKYYKYTPEAFNLKCEQSFDFTPEALTQLDYSKSLDILDMFNVELPMNFQRVKLNLSEFKYSAPKTTEMTTGNRSEASTSTVSSKPSPSRLAKMLEDAKALAATEISEEDMKVLKEIQTILATVKIKTVDVKSIVSTKDEATEKSENKLEVDLQAVENSRKDALKALLERSQGSIPMSFEDDEDEELEENIEEEELDTIDLLCSQFDIEGDEESDIVSGMEIFPEERPNVNDDRETLVKKLNDALEFHPENKEFHLEILRAIHAFQG